ncbi:MAG: response regulator transcription factor [Chloroflexi bacterium]|nr:MAG: response regulator transcription factor [Chloroflexota bacterium]TMD84695.1 MAG: response regulator transcription factor [Chloroflexota bacterium]
MTAPIRVLIVDDHAVVRRGLRAFLDLQPEVEVVGEATDGATAEALTATLRPDVVLMDLVMPGTDGIATIRRLRQSVAAAAILVLTSYLDDVHLFAALEAGAAGYLLKDVQPDELVRAIRQTHQGESALHPKVAARLVQHTARPASFADFTPRERDVLRLLAEGFPNKEIARRLSLSEKTVKTHVSNILQKLGVSDRTQAALMAVRRGLVG